MGEAGTLIGRVTNAQGKPLMDAVVMIVGDSPSHRDIAALTDEQGAFKFGNLSPGRYTLMVNAEDHPQETKQIEVLAGEIAQLDFPLPR